MSNISFRIGILAAAILLPGCSSVNPLRDSANEPPLAMTPELHAALKRAYGFDDEHINLELQAARQLEAKLREVGAKFAADGKMYDRNGKEVYLWSNGPGIGAQIFESELREMQEQRRKAFEEARRRYTLIDVGYWGPQLP